MRKGKPWSWVPTLYFAEGIPYVLVMTLSVIFYKRMGISNTMIALYTSWLYLPWVIKPLWSPVVDILKSKRFWIVLMQLFIGAGLAGVALTIPADRFFQLTLAFFWLLAFGSATHDIAADGFYMLGLSEHDQAYFVGIRSTFYRIAMLTGQGLLVILAGYFEAKTGLNPVEVEVVAAKGDTGITAFRSPEERATENQAGTPEEGGEAEEAREAKEARKAEEAQFLYEDRVTIACNPISGQRADSIMREVERWNTSHGFYGEGEEKWEGSTGEAPAGNVGLTGFRLNRPPGEDERIILNFSFERGDKSIRLARSYRYEFTVKNWDIPAYALYQLDPKLDRNAAATFRGTSGNIRFAWSMVFLMIAFLFAGFSLYHRFILPKPEGERRSEARNSDFFREFLLTFAEFFKKKEIGVILLFLLVYRLGESQLVKLASPFLLDSRESGGIGLATGDLGLIYGTVGIIALSMGGITGGISASRKGLRYWLWWMVAAMNLPNLVYVFLSFTLPSRLWVISSCVAVEQYGYGFGFTAYMLYMIYVSEGRYKTAHFALTTGFMALGMMLPGMISGWLQELLGYRYFFIWVMLCTIPGFLVIPHLRIDRDFGRKTKAEEI